MKRLNWILGQFKPWFRPVQWYWNRVVMSIDIVMIAVNITCFVFNIINAYNSIVYALLAPLHLIMLLVHTRDIRSIKVYKYKQIRSFNKVDRIKEHEIERKKIKQILNSHNFSKELTKMNILLDGYECKNCGFLYNDKAYINVMNIDDIIMCDESKLKNLLL